MELASDEHACVRKVDICEWFSQDNGTDDYSMVVDANTLIGCVFNVIQFQMHFFDITADNLSLDDKNKTLYWWWIVMTSISQCASNIYINCLQKKDKKLCML